MATSFDQLKNQATQNGKYIELPEQKVLGAASGVPYGDSGPQQWSSITGDDYAATNSFSLGGIPITGISKVLPFKHPVYKIDHVKVVGKQAAMNALKTREPTEFIIETMVVSDDDKGGIVSDLFSLGILPTSKTEIPSFYIEHPQLQSCGITTVMLDHVEQPTWHSGPMVYRFYFIEDAPVLNNIKKTDAKNKDGKAKGKEGAKPKPYAASNSDIFNNARSGKSTALGARPGAALLGPTAP